MSYPIERPSLALIRPIGNCVLNLFVKGSPKFILKILLLVRMFCNIDSYVFEKLDWYVDWYVISTVSCTSLVS